MEEPQPMSSVIFVATMTTITSVNLSKRFKCNRLSSKIRTLLRIILQLPYHMGRMRTFFKKIKMRACYGEIVAFDLNTNQFVKLEEGPSQLQLETENTMKLSEEQQMKNTLKQTF
jgi:hypothetical protein